MAPSVADAFKDGRFVLPFQVDPSSLSRVKKVAGPHPKVQQEAMQETKPKTQPLGGMLLAS
jgi:hypothetical protein